MERIIRKEYPHLIEKIDDETYQLYSKALTQKLDIEDIISHMLHITDENSHDKFKLRYITSPWDPYEILSRYINNDNTITLEDIRQYFYWNATLQCIQTVNYANNDREIQTIIGDYSSIDITKLDIYHNAYLSYSIMAPKKYYGLKLLIVDSMKGDPIDNIIDYIKTNGMISVTSLRTLFRDTLTLIPTDLGINTIIRQLNDKCIDITYNNKDISNVDTLSIGDLPSNIM